MKSWLEGYLEEQKRVLGAVDTETVARITGKLREALHEDRGIFAFGNGASAALASHFAADLGKSASAAAGKRFRCMSLADNVPWITAIGNDCAYEDIFARQMENFARPGDLALAISVSGGSPSTVKAAEWARDNGLFVIALAGKKGGRLSDIADIALIIDSAHYGHAEDAHGAICHMLAYAFIDHPAFGKP